jgi:hypothetical protein
VKRPRSPAPIPPDPPPIARPSIITPPSSSSSEPPATLLGKYAIDAACLLRHLGWPAFIRHLQHPSDYAADLHLLPHPAGPYLARLARSGIPAPSSAAPWSSNKRHRIVERGPHPSAAQHYCDFLYEDLLDMVSKRYWVVLPFAAIKHHPHLKLSPCGIVPQRTRRPRPIMDYTFTGVNQASLPIAPTHAMQFGQALSRILQRIADAGPLHGPVLLAKFDLSDGCYRVCLSPEAALELAVILPSPDPRRPLVGIPLSIPMGWAHSPPYFCAYTETAADLANQHCSDPALCLPPHPLERESQQPRVPLSPSFHPACLHLPTHANIPSPLSYTDVYIDDFISLAQRICASHTLRNVLWAISALFRHPPHPDDSPSRKQVISASKLAQGDGAWSKEKIVLGWLLNTAAGTIALPLHKRDRLHDILTQFIGLKRTSRRKWQQLLGELHHMALAIRGASFLFSIFQSVLVDHPTATRLCLSPLVQTSLQDWLQLADSLATNPVPITTLVPRAPTYIGAVDASQAGLGGFWIPSRFGSLPTPIAFRMPFPYHIQQRLVSATNPKGTITNSDLELAAIITGATTVSSITPTYHPLLLCASDNTPAVAWTTKGSTSSTGLNAHLLRWLAHVCRTSHFDLRVIATPGTSNTIADFCSRSFHLSDQDFLTDLNARFPIHPSWQLVHPTNTTTSDVTSALLCKMSPWASVPPAPMPPTPPGPSGVPFVPTSTSTPCYPTSPTPSSSSNYSLIDTELAKLLPAKLQFAAERWETPFVIGLP